jgi:hypothetical protein
MIEASHGYMLGRAGEHLTALDYWLVLVYHLRC